MGACGFLPPWWVPLGGTVFWLSAVCHGSARVGFSPSGRETWMGWWRKERRQSMVNTRMSGMLSVMWAKFQKGEWRVCRPEEARGHAASVTFTNVSLSVIIPAAASLSTFMKRHLCVCEFVCRWLCEILSLSVGEQVTATALNPFDLYINNDSYSQWPKWKSQLVENEQSRRWICVTSTKSRRRTVGSDQTDMIQFSVTQIVWITKPVNIPKTKMSRVPCTCAILCKWWIRTAWRGDTAEAKGWKYWSNHIIPCGRNRRNESMISWTALGRRWGKQMNGLL